MDDNKTVNNSLEIDSGTLESLGKAATTVGILQGILRDIAGNPLFAGAGAVYAVKRLVDEFTKFQKVSQTAEGVLKKTKKALDDSKDSVEELSEYQKYLASSTTTSYTLSGEAIKKYTKQVNEGEKGVENLNTTTKSHLATMLKTPYPYVFAAATIASLINKIQEMRKQIAKTSVEMYNYTYTSGDRMRVATAMTLKQLDIQQKYGEDVARMYGESVKELDSRLSRAESDGTKLTSLYEKIALVSGTTGVNFARATKSMYDGFKQYNIDGTKAFTTTMLFKRAIEEGRSPLGDLGENMEFAIEQMLKYKQEGQGFDQALRKTMEDLAVFGKMGLTTPAARELAGFQTGIGGFGQAGVQKRIGLTGAITASGGISSDMRDIFSKAGVDLGKNDLQSALFLLQHTGGGKGVLELQQLLARRITGLKEGDDIGNAGVVKQMYEKLSGAGTQMQKGYVLEQAGIPDLESAMKLATSSLGKTGDAMDAQKSVTYDFNAELQRATQNLKVWGDELARIAEKQVTWLDALSVTFEKIGIGVATGTPATEGEKQLTPNQVRLKRASELAGVSPIFAPLTIPIKAAEHVANKIRSAFGFSGGQTQDSTTVSTSPNQPVIIQNHNVIMLDSTKIHESLQQQEAQTKQTTPKTMGQQ